MGEGEWWRGREGKRKWEERGLESDRERETKGKEEHVRERQRQRGVKWIIQCQRWP